MKASWKLCAVLSILAIVVFTLAEKANSQVCSLSCALSGEATNDQFGYQVSGAGDVDGDGYDDVIVGALYSDSAGSNAGRAYVYSGRTCERLWTFDGEAAGDQFGISVGGAGDVNSDGFADLIVGANRNSAGGNWSGRAYVYSGQSGELLWTFTGEVAGDFFGYSVSGVGDVDSDGYDDVIVGAIWNNSGGTRSGRAYVFSGQTGDTLFTLTGEAAGDYLGLSVSEAGDVNGDGHPDMILGAPNAGKAYVHSGLTGDMIMVLRGETGGDSFGYRVSGARDVNNDGYDDVIVGAYLNSAGGYRAGRAYVFFGRADTVTILAADADKILTGEAVDDSFGKALSDAGDLNGDGFADVIVGAAQNDANGNIAGRSYVFFGAPGSATIAAADADRILTGDTAGVAFGASVSSAGDVNGDGVNDLIISALLAGASGEAYIYSCSENQSPVAICRSVSANASDSCLATVPPDSVDFGSYDPDGDSLTFILEPPGPYFLGFTEVQLIATDGSLADTCTTTISVIDREPPAVNCPDSIVVQAWDMNCVVVDYIVAATDNCPSVTVNCSTPSGSCFPIGWTDVECVASDAAGNEDTCHFSVTVLPPPCDTLWIEPTNIRYGPDGCRVPVMLGNCTELEGLTIPLVYDSLPEGWSCDSVSFVDSRMADWDLVTNSVNPLDNTVLVEGLVDIDGSGKLVEPGETGALFYIWISGPGTPTVYDDLADVICFDTTTIPASPSAKALLLVEDATPSVGFVPIFVEGCVSLYHYRPIDLDCNGNLNAVDLANLIDIVFFGDPCGCVCFASDVNGDGFTDAIDLSLAIDCIFFGAACPVCDGDGSPSPLARRAMIQADARLNFTHPQSGTWEATLNISSPVPWRIAKLEWEFDSPPDNLDVELAGGAAGLTSYWRQDGQSLIIGLLDVQGEVVIPSGDRSIVRVTGAGSMPGIRLADGMLVNPSHQGVAVHSVSLAGSVSSVPVSFELGQNYPNPFNAGTVIYYSIGTEGPIRLEIFNILGRRVRTLVDEFVAVGRHEVAWDGTDEFGNSLSSGMYFYRLTTNGRVESRKMVLLK